MALLGEATAVVGQVTKEAMPSLFLLGVSGTAFSKAKFRTRDYNVLTESG